MKPIIKSALAASVLAIAFNAQAAVDFTVDPASGSTHETLSQITLVCPDYEFSFDSSMKAADVTVLKDGETFGGVTFLSDWMDWHKIYVNFTPALTEAGTYTVNIGANAIVTLDADEGVENPLNTEDVTYTYIITGTGGGGGGNDDDDPDLTLRPNSITPADGETVDISDGSWSNIMLFFDANVKLNGTPMASITSEDGSYNQSVGLIDFGHVQKGAFFISTLDLGTDELPATDGIYYVTVPANSFTNGTEANPELKLTYEITGAERQVVETVELYNIEIVDSQGTTELVNDLKLAKFEDGTRFVFNTSNDLAVGYLTMSIYDRDALNPDEAFVRRIESRAARLLIEPLGSYWNDNEAPYIKMSRDLELLEGHTYDIEVEVFDFENPPYTRTELAKAAYVIEGTTPGYKYSDIKVESITPEAGTTFNKADEGIITIKFSGEVKINESKSFFYVDLDQTSFSGHVTMSDDNTEATIQFPPSMLENAIGVVGMMIYVTDMDGNSLFFGYDNGDENHINLEYSCYLGTPELDVEPGEGIIEEFSQMIVRYNGKESIAWANNFEAGAVELRDLGSREGRVFGYIRSFETYKVAMVPGDQGPVEGTVAIIGYLEDADGNRITINTPGKYVLAIPAASFNMGDGFSGFTNKQTFINYTIEGEIPDETVYDFDPTSKTVTYNDEHTVATVELIFPDEVYTNGDVIEQVALYDTDGNKLDADIENDFDFDNLSLWIFKVTYNFVDNTPYELRVPRGAFGDAEWESNATYAQYNTGHANEEFIVPILTTSGVENVLLGTNETGVVYNLQGIKIGTTDDVKALPAGLYIVNGKKMYVK